MTLNDYLCVVPVKGHSQRLKDKNLLPIGNRSLFLHTVDNIRSVGLTPVVSTDNESIYNRCLFENVAVVCESVDDSRMENCINNVLSKLRVEKDIILFQPTSPFRSREHILSVIDNYTKTRKGIITTKRIRPLLYKDGLPLFDVINRKTSQNTKDSDYYHYFDGNMVITNYSRYLETGTLIPPDVDLYWNKEEFRSVDIDTEMDYLLAVALYERGYR